MNIENLSVQRRKKCATLLVGIQFILLFVIGIMVLLRVGRGSHNYLVFELISIAIGTLVITVAGLALKPSLRISPIPKSNAPLIASGIYRFVRHPMYLGVILIGFGMTGYADSILAWILEVALVVDLNIKARFEDALLREIHPESIHYQLHVSRLLPCVGGSCRANCSAD